MNGMLFETQRLAVRRLTAEDAEAMLAIYGDVGGMRFVGDGVPLDLAACLHWVEVTDRNFERRGYGMVAACDRVSGDLVACVGVVHPNQQEEPEVKYALRRDVWGRGIATELVKATVDYAWSHLGKTRLIATVHPDHHASQRVLAKVGFHRDDDRINDDGSLTQVWVWSA